MGNPEIIRHGGENIGTRTEESEPRPFENTIIALDVDGVLVRPSAYRLAVGLTINFFAEQLGVDSKDFTVEDRYRSFGRNMNHFEAEGIHDPWDVSTIIVALMKLKKAGINISNSDALEAFKANSTAQSHPPDVILNWIIERYQNVLRVEDAKDIAQTLSNTRNPFKNEVTSIFQEFVLGRETFQTTYGRPSRTNTEESLIATKDQSLIDDRARREIDRMSQQGGMIVIYTGRPGLPPSDARRRQADGYAPEAEFAVEKSRVTALGIVSMGSMEWLGRATKTSVESLTKPNPTQALAAILSAFRGRVEMQVLMDAYRWGQTGDTPEELQSFIEKKTRLNLVVVEDSPSGVRAFVSARRVLENNGINVGLTAIGVHDVSFEKHMAFMRLKQEEGIDVVDTNSGIREGIIRYSYEIRGRAEMEGPEDDLRR